MALEQKTYEKNRLTGIMAYVDINSAVNRGHVSRAMRSEIANALIE